MEDQSESNAASGSRSWLERLNQALLREPRDQHQLLELLREAQQRKGLGRRSPEHDGGRSPGFPDESSGHRDSESADGGSGARLATGPNPQKWLSIRGIRGSPWSVRTVTKCSVRCWRRTCSGISPATNRRPLALTTLLRPAKFIPESKRLNVLLREFRLSRLHMAIVIDEYGGVCPNDQYRRRARADRRRDRR